MSQTEKALREALAQAVEWDSHDAEGVPAIWLEAARAALSLPETPSQPAQGWKLVPVEPTPEMFGAASTALHKLYLREGGWCGEKAAKEQALETWQAMLAAAPAAPEAK